VSQTHTPKDVPCRNVKLTDADRKKLDVWPEERGWCSACGQGLAWGKQIPVVHIGNRKKDVDVAMCGKCLARMTAALPTAASAP
jgi:hypothetical protein